MKSRIVTSIDCETDKIRFGYWEEEIETWVELEVGDDLNEASQKLNCSEELLDALLQTMEVMRDQISADFVLFGNGWINMNDNENTGCTHPETRIELTKSGIKKVCKACGEGLKDFSEGVTIEKVVLPTPDLEKVS